MKHKYDIIIVGAGFIGLTLSLMLSKSGLKVCLLEKKKKTLNDNRTTAISQGTKRIFEKLELWKYIKKNSQPIKKIVISESDNFDYIDFNSKSLDEGNLGFIVENFFFRKVLFNEVKKNKKVGLFLNTEVEGIRHDYQDDKVYVFTKKLKFEGNLLIGADGRFSKVRDMLNLKYYFKDYKQNAYVFNLEHTQNHNGIALERFFPEGPLAILPMKQLKKNCFRSSVVWTIDDALGDFSKLTQEEFRKEFSMRYQNFFGDINNITKPFKYPLNLIYAYDSYNENSVLVGDASQGIHPIAGQGFNLGMRDCMILNKRIEEAFKNGLPISSTLNLKRYELSRFIDKKLFINATDFLNTIFSNNHFLVRNLRKIGLLSINQSDNIKNELMKNAMGLRTFGILDQFH